MQKKNMFLGIVAIGIMLLACKKDNLNVGIAAGVSTNIATQCAKEPDLKVFTAALKATGLDSTLNQFYGNYTVFAPSDQAFNAIGITETNLSTALPSLQALRNALKYHVIPGKIKKADFLIGPNARYLSLSNDSLFETTVIGNSTDIFLNGKSKIVSADILTTNGFIHKVDGVLLPPVFLIDSIIHADPNYSYLAAAVDMAGLRTFFKTRRSTLFAPTNHAFIDAGFATIDSIIHTPVDTINKILTYHVLASRNYALDIKDASTLKTVQGSNIMFFVNNGVKVKGNGNATSADITKADVLAINGIIHTINQLLKP
jgi:uncharacterized surface protein with fasciclin (FAS1) repeats